MSLISELRSSSHFFRRSGGVSALAHIGTMAASQLKFCKMQLEQHSNIVNKIGHNHDSSNCPNCHTLRRHAGMPTARRVATA